MGPHRCKPEVATGAVALHTSNVATKNVDSPSAASNNNETWANLDYAHANLALPPHMMGTSCSVPEKRTWLARLVRRDRPPASRSRR